MSRSLTRASFLDNTSLAILQDNVRNMQDSWANFVAGFGTEKDKAVFHEPVLNLLSPQYLMNLYRGDWLSRKICDIPAFDCTRAWRSWQAEPEQIEAIEATEKFFNIQTKMMQAFIRARLWGGALIILGVDQGRFDEPLDIDKVKKGDLKFVHVVGRWNVSVGPLIRDITSPWYGQPQYYFRSNNINPPSPDPKIEIPPSELGYDPGFFFYIHPSRTIRVTGNDYPDIELSPDAWSDSVLQTVFDAIRDTNLVTSSIASVLSEAKYDIIKVPGLTNKMATTEGSAALAKRFGGANVMKSTVNATLLDIDEEWVNNQVQLGSYDKVMSLYMLMVCGAADIPATRVMGREPAGLNATGASDIRNYYDRLSSEQVAKIGPMLTPLDEILLRHTFGDRDPGIHYTWNPLWQMDADVKSQVTLRKAQAFEIHFASGLIDPNVMRQGLESQLTEDDIYPNLKSAIDEFESNRIDLEYKDPAEEPEPPMPINGGGNPKTNGGSNGAKPKSTSSSRSGASDAAERPLYVYRPLQNAVEFKRWAKDQGFDNIVEDLHVTLVYSRSPVNWMKMGGSPRIVTVPEGGPRVIDTLGEGAVVLQFASYEFNNRHDCLVDRGCSHDYLDYQPHVTISYDPGDTDLDDVEPFDGELVFGPERFKAIKPVGDSVHPFDEFNEALHPREAAGTSLGGRFAGGAAGFVSPNVKTGLDLPGAVRALKGPQQAHLLAAATDIDAKVGLTTIHTSSIVGFWQDDVENSVMTSSGSDWDHMALATVMKGFLADQKAVLVFQEQEGGKSALAHFEATGKIKAIHRNLLKDGVEAHTLIPHADGSGATVYVADLDGSHLDAIERGAQRYGEDNHAIIQFGRGEFIGTNRTDGTDREQRDSAREVYEGHIRGSKVQGAGALWADIRNRWGASTDKVGYNLTSNAIIAESGVIKPNSIPIIDIARDLNKRAGRVLKHDLGVDHVGLDNHNEAMDDYLAKVIALELRDGLQNGRSGADWYDNTMRDAMGIAGSLYPGVADNPDKKFIYTTALAVTSQGETVPSNVRLADQVYEHFQKTGKFPVDLAVKKPSINKNFQKINEFIESKGIVKTREFFNQEMTNRELLAQTGKKVNKTGMDDMVYGSAILGPKIGQGFYQNLNGNFKPITMDLWFMRSWGRITNTGIGDVDTEPVAEKFTNELKKAGVPVPASRKTLVKLAEGIESQHEIDYDAHAAEYKSGKRSKSDLVLSAIRLSMNSNGTLVEAPRGAEHRRWMTAVFNKSLDKVKENTGITLSPAGAQATWWNPEKVLYTELGGKGKQLDTDYLKSLRDLAKSRGIEV